MGVAFLAARGATRLRPGRRRLAGAGLLALLCAILTFAGSPPLPHSIPHGRAAAPLGAPAGRATLIALAESIAPPIGHVDAAAAADARRLNAAHPFAQVYNPAAAPFIERVGGDDRARATDCLAAAAFYEAGDDAVGQRSVVQVVLNRVRHPAFPSSICGVVFQGSERRTGCQFTFTCDGAMARIPSAAAWSRAQRIASFALDGAVDPDIGTATHYHTDWVFPAWSPRLDKVGRVRTHLFFRWPGRLGTPAAFDSVYAGAEPRVAKLAGLSPAHREPALHLDVADAVFVAPAAVDLPAARPAAGPPLQERLPAMAAAPDSDTFLVTLPAGSTADHLALAARTCGNRGYCKFVGWTDATRAASSMPIPGSAIDAISFLFVRDEAGTGTARWNCREFPRAQHGECLPGA